MADILLEMQNIVKEFPGVKALNNVNIKVRKGTIHAIVGENGAGKSTLMKILSGLYPYGSYTGDIVLEGNVCKFKTIKESEEKGIVIIHQELALIPLLSIMENMFLGNEQQKNGVIHWSDCRYKAMEVLNTVGLKEDPQTLIQQIGVGKQQLVEIAKALAKNANLLILDEPTAALNDEESDKLLDLIMNLRDEHGLTAVIISHKLGEVMKVADDITIIRDGTTVETMSMETDEITEDRIVKGMVGRELSNRYPSRNTPIGEVRFEIKNWFAYHPKDKNQVVINNINMNLKRGEVVGIAGLMGAGRTEFAMSLFGKAYGSRVKGQITKDGQPLDVSNVYNAIQSGIAYLTEDRKTYGLVLQDTICRNISLPSLEKLSKGGVVNQNEEVRVAEEYLKKMEIRSPNISQLLGNLSGGNQQKVLLARWIYANPDLLILDEPTRGIDVGAKYEIYKVINALAAEGKCVLFISSELPEVLGISDRIYVMNEGTMVGEFLKEDATQEKIMKAIVGHSGRNAE